MTGQIIISLDSGWECAYFEHESDINELAAADAPVDLPTWTLDQRRSSGGAAWLRRRFRLEPTDVCVRYLLVIDSAPTGTQVHLNDRFATEYRAGDDDASFELDVTNMVWLDTNTIAFRVGGTAVGRFAGVRLQAVECE